MGPARSLFFPDRVVRVRLVGGPRIEDLLRVLEDPLELRVGDDDRLVRVGLHDVAHPGQLGRLDGREPLRGRDHVLLLVEEDDHVRVLGPGLVRGSAGDVLLEELVARGLVVEVDPAPAVETAGHGEAGLVDEDDLVRLRAVDPHELRALERARADAAVLADLDVDGGRARRTDGAARPVAVVAEEVALVAHLPVRAEAPELAGPEAPRDRGPAAVEDGEPEPRDPEEAERERLLPGARPFDGQGERSARLGAAREREGEAELERARLAALERDLELPLVLERPAHDAGDSVARGDSEGRGLRDRRLDGDGADERELPVLERTLLHERRDEVRGLLRDERRRQLDGQVAGARRGDRPGALGEDGVARVLVFLEGELDRHLGVARREIEVDGLRQEIGGELGLDRERRARPGERLLGRRHGEDGALDRDGRDLGESAAGADLELELGRVDRSFGRAEAAAPDSVLVLLEVAVLDARREAERAVLEVHEDLDRPRREAEGARAVLGLDARRDEGRDLHARLALDRERSVGVHDPRALPGVDPDGPARERRDLAVGEERDARAGTARDGRLAVGEDEAERRVEVGASDLLHEEAGGLDRIRELDRAGAHGVEKRAVPRLGGERRLEGDEASLELVAHGVDEEPARGLVDEQAVGVRLLLADLLEDLGGDLAVRGDDVDLVRRVGEDRPRALRGGAEDRDHVGAAELRQALDRPQDAHEAGEVRALALDRDREVGRRDRDVPAGAPREREGDRDRHAPLAVRVAVEDAARAVEDDAGLLLLVGPDGGAGKEHGNEGDERRSPSPREAARAPHRLTSRAIGMILTSPSFSTVTAPVNRPGGSEEGTLNLTSYFPPSFTVRRMSRSGSITARVPSRTSGSNLSGALPPTSSSVVVQPQLPLSMSFFGSVATGAGAVIVALTGIVRMLEPHRASTEPSNAPAARECASRTIVASPSSASGALGVSFTPRAATGAVFFSVVSTVPRSISFGTEPRWTSSRRSSRKGWRPATAGTTENPIEPPLPRTLSSTVALAPAAS